MPKPSAGESEQDFVSRCIPVVLKDGTAKDNAQAAAICHSVYGDKERRDKEHSGAMVALMLDASDTAALVSALPPEYQAESDLHVTLAYLGKAADLTPQQRSDIDAALARVAVKFGLITGVVGGVGFFNQDAESQRVLYASYDAPELPAFRQAIMEALTAVGAPVDDMHGFTPHITLAYCPNEYQAIVPDLPALNITFPCVVRMFGGDRSDSYFNSDMAKEYIPASLEMLKQADGTYRWVLISSNSFEDRDRELISQRALEADVARADQDGDYGPLLFWHLNGKRNKEGEQLPLVVFGHCDFNAMHGRMLIESGTFVSEAVARSVEAAKENLEVSIGFDFPEYQLDATGVIHEIRRKERSLLPRGVASNRITAVPVIYKESPMLKDKLEALTKVLGGNKELVSQVLQLAESGEKEALAAGVRTKAKDDDKKVPADDKPNGLDAVADAPYPKKVAEDDADPKKDDNEKDMVKKKEFEPVMAALITKLDQLEADLHILNTSSAEKAQRDTDTATRVKEIGETLTAVKQLAEKANDGVLELKGELPRRLGDPLAAYRPSTHGKEPPAEKIKQATPEHDPWSKHMNALLPQTNPFVPPGN